MTDTLVDEAACDRISGRIMEVLSAEAGDAGTSRLNLLGGVLLALVTIEKVLPKEHRPPCMETVFRAADECLTGLAAISECAEATSSRPSR
jgi:hypothetical protein